MIGRALVADIGVLVGLAARLYRQMQHVLHRRIAFVEALREHAGIAIKRKCHLGHVVGTNGKAVEVFLPLVGQNSVQRNARTSSPS